MNTNKFLIGGIIGGIANFLLGLLVWGMLLMNFIKEHTTEAGNAVMRGENGMVWWAMIAGSLCWGLTLSFVLSRSGANSATAPSRSPRLKAPYARRAISTFSPDIAYAVSRGVGLVAHPVTSAFA